MQMHDRLSVVTATPPPPPPPPHPPFPTHTGSVYCDFRLRPSFPGETIHDGSVLAVKTHNTNIGNFKSAIFIMRDLRDAMISNWNRIKSWNSHTQSVGQQHFCK